MKITVAQIKNAEPVLAKLMNQQLPFKVSFRITKILESVSKDIENFEKHRAKLFEKYGELQGDSMVIKSENFDEFKKDLDILLQETVDLPDVKLSLDDLNDVQISPGELIFFMPWMEDTE